MGPHQFVDLTIFLRHIVRESKVSDVSQKCMREDLLRMRRMKTLAHVFGMMGGYEGLSQEAVKIDSVWEALLRDLGEFRGHGDVAQSGIADLDDRSRDGCDGFGIVLVVGTVCDGQHFRREGLVLQDRLCELANVTFQGGGQGDDARDCPP